MPGAETIKVTFDQPEQISRLKVLGASPYRLRITGRDGSSLGFSAVDLSKLESGWNSVESSSLISSSAVELRFEALSPETAKKVPEIELWAAREPSESGRGLDITQPDLPHGHIKLSPAIGDAELTPGNCGVFDLELTRSPSMFEKAYLVYEARGLFRSFTVNRTINGLADYGGAWLDAEPDARSAFADEIDPDTLHLGHNDLRLCLPEQAPHVAAISNLHIVAKLDVGHDLSSSASLGADGRDAGSLRDGDPSTSMMVSKDERVTLTFDHLVAPDAVVVRGTALVPEVVRSVECIDRAGKSDSIDANPLRSSPNELVLALDGHALHCAQVAVTVGGAALLSELDIVGSGSDERVDWPRIVVTSPAEHFGRSAWVGGFVARPPVMTGAIRVAVAGAAAESMTGDFGRLLARNEDVALPWTVAVTATCPDGSKLSRQTLLDRDAHGQLATSALASSTAMLDAQSQRLFGKVGDLATARATLMQASKVRLGASVGLDIPIGAVTTPTNIVAKHLAETALPPLDPGMINVTAPKGHGYEFLPHGQKFAKPVEVILPFDARLIPDGMKADDVFMYYFDTKIKKWRKLDRAAIELRDQTIRSRSDHFTIMIDAVLAVPSNPSPLAYDPTAMSSIPAASPAANIDMIEPPDANSSGDARLSLPIRLPAGRGAYSPSLGFNYSSSGGASWLGVGWDLTLPSIDIDTRWGVPTYADGEEPRYMLGGAALVPTRDSDGPGCSGGEPSRRYHPRIEGEFAHILRCGANPSNYYFEVYDRNGTRYVYGSKTADNAGNPWLLSTKARPCGGGCGPGIARWALREVVDSHGNTTTFDYFIDEVSGTEPGRQQYPKSISYTSHASLPAAYSVEFVRDDGSRPDRMVNGRSGFKMVTRHLLRAVRVNFGTERIREYVLTYEPGQFSKSRLKTIAVYGLGGCAASLGALTPPSCSAAFFYDHEFTYAGTELQNGGFADAQLWNVEGTPADVTTLGKGKSKSTSANVGVTVGNSAVSGTLGASISLGSRNEFLGMYDINGDGLADQLLDQSGSILPIMNKYRGNDNPGLTQFGADTSQFAIDNLTALGSEKHNSWSIDASAGLKGGMFQISASGGYSSSTARAKRFLIDLDGDGFTDVLGGQPQNSQPCPVGQCFTDLDYTAMTQIDPQQDSVLGELETDIEQQLMLGDPVVRWIAPYDGDVIVAGTVSLLHSGEVTVDLLQQDGPDDKVVTGWPRPLSPSTGPIAVSELLKVTAGDSIYLRVATGSDTGIDGSTLNDEVNADLSFTYSVTGALLPKEPTAALVYQFGMNEHLRVNGRPVVIPADGTIILHGDIHKNPTDADIRVCLQQLKSSDPETDVPCVSGMPSWTFAQATSTVQPIDLMLNVRAGDVIILRAESDYSFDPKNIWFEPTPNPFFPNVTVPLGYLSACLLNPETSSCEPVDPADLPLDGSSFGMFAAPATPPEPAGTVPMPFVVPFVSPAVTYWSVQPFANPLGSKPVTVAIRSDLEKTILVFQCPGTTCTPPPNSSGVYIFHPIVGESVSFEVTADFDDPSVLPPQPYYIPIFPNNKTPSYSAPLIFRKKKPTPAPHTPFAGNYRGFSSTFWNEAIAFEPSRLLADYADPDIGDASDARKLEIASSAVLPTASFTGTSLTGGVPAWFAPGSSAFVSETGHMNAASVAALPPGVPEEVANPQAELYSGGYGRLSATKSLYLGVGAEIGLPVVPITPSLSATITRSWTKTTTDVMDVNGDGIADVINGNRTIAGNIDAPGVEIPLHFGEAFRKRDAFDYSFGMGSSASVRNTNSSGRSLNDSIAGKAAGSFGIGSSLGLSLSRTQTTTDLADMNGDGLVDEVRRVHENGQDLIKVRYNFGTSLGAEETLTTITDTNITGAIDGFESATKNMIVLGGLLDSSSDALSHETTLTQTKTFHIDLWVLSYSSSTRTNASRTTRQLADINGDGLPDLLVKRSDQHDIFVLYNRGYGFASTAVPWDTPSWGTTNISPGFDGSFTDLAFTGPDVLAASSSENSKSSSGGLSIPVVPGVVSLNLGLSRSSDTDTYEMGLVDVTGDGAPDHVLRRSQGANASLYVKKNNIDFKSNLLTEVRGPLGGKITLGYLTKGNTVNLASQRVVLTSVNVDDNVDLGTGYESPNVSKVFQYFGGYFDRNEKEFYGFSTVTAERFQPLEPGNVVQRIEREYNNSDYWLHGQLTRETVSDRDGRVYSQHTITWQTRNVVDATSAPVTDSACAAALHPLLKRAVDACTPKFNVVTQDVQMRTEDGGVVTKTRIIQDTNHDRFGNVLVSLDSGDNDVSSDDIAAVAQYQNDLSHWKIGQPTMLEVRAGSTAGTLLRKRAGRYLPNGDLWQIDVYADAAGSPATTTLDYDIYGNVRHLTTPPNHSGEEQSYDVTFDTTTESYPISKTDAFGYTSTATYDPRYGIATIETDTNGTQVIRTVDAMGRLATVRGPYDTGPAPGLELQYYSHETKPRAVTIARASAPPGYTGPVAGAITTVSIADGLGREIERNRTAVVGGTSGMITDGLVQLDAAGRKTKVYQPFFTAGASTAFIAPVAINPTTTVYDVIDRPVSVTHPDSATESTSYSTVSFGGTTLFRAQHVDPNSHPREMLTDFLGRTRYYSEHPTTATTSTTAYDYRPTGELAQITDAEGNVTTLAYDMRGLRTSMSNPDTGLIEDFFDPMGNRIFTITPNLRALGQKTEFTYERNRLKSILYPSPSKPPVEYTYGAPGAPNGQAGRVVSVSDESGELESEYDAFGQVTRTRRTVSYVGKSFDMSFAYDSFGRQLAVTYPDGEVVKNSYDAAGNLLEVTGQGGSWVRTYAENMTYDVFGNRTHVVRGNGVTTDWTYEPLRVRLHSMTTTAGSRAIQNLTYTYDPASNPTQVSNNLPPLLTSDVVMPGASTLTLTYDGVDRLTHASGSGQWNYQYNTTYDEGFTYTPSHNIATKSLAHTIDSVPQPGYSDSYGYDAARPHLPETIGSQSLLYDASGNPTDRRDANGNQVTLIWDDDNRLVQVVGSGYEHFYIYDATGQRVVRKTDTLVNPVTVFVNQYYDEDEGSNGTKHIFAGGMRIASAIGDPESNDPWPAYYFHVNHLGSTGVLTDEAGDVYQSTEYFVDGATWIDRAPSSPVSGYLFNGKMQDPDTGFYDFGQRFYDPRTSVWLGIDPAFTADPKKSAAYPVMLALVAYGGHSPLRSIDPDGRDTVIRTDNAKRIDQVRAAIQELVGTEGTVGIQPTGGGAAWGVRLTLSQTAKQRANSSEPTKLVSRLINSSKLVVIESIDPRNARPNSGDRAGDARLDEMLHINPTSIGDCLAAGGAGTLNRDPAEKDWFGWFDGEKTRYIDSLIVIDYSHVKDMVDGKNTDKVPQSDASVTGHELVHAELGFTADKGERAKREQNIRRFENKYLRKDLGPRDENVPLCQQ